MGRAQEYAVIDVVAQPHPPGIYRDIFKASIAKGVKYRGEYFAAITPISETRNDIFTGRLAIWMSVDKASNVINLEDFVEVPLSDATDVVIPPGRGLNSRVFEFAFNERTHKLYVSMKNDIGKTVTPYSAERAFEAILSYGADKLVDELRVQVVPEKNSVERVLSIPNVSRIEMKIYRPNPDHVAETEKFLDSELDDQNVGEETRILKKAPGAKEIILNAKNMLAAQAASVAGWIKAKGKDESGQVVEASTKDYPKIIRRSADDETEFGGARSVAGE